jgi:hypothetical protein
MSTRDAVEPSQIDYHAEIQAQRVQRALQRIDPGDVLAVIDSVLAVIDSRIVAEPDPKAHPLYTLVCFFLDRQRAVDGGAFYDHFRQLVLAAIDTCLDDALEALED